MNSDPVRLAASSSPVVADVVDAIRWHDQKDEELKALKTQDVNNQSPWLDALIEDFIAFDPTPSDSAAKASEILVELNKELDVIQNAGYGPEAADYIEKLKRELELVIEKLEMPDATPQTKDQQEQTRQDENQ